MTKQLFFTQGYVFLKFEYHMISLFNTGIWKFIHICENTLGNAYNVDHSSFKCEVYHFRVLNAGPSINCTWSENKKRFSVIKNNKKENKSIVYYC